MSREVANFTGRKNTHTPVYGVKELVCLSVTNFDLNYLRTGEIEKKFARLGARAVFICPFLTKKSQILTK